MDCSLSYWHYEVGMVGGFVPCSGQPPLLSWSTPLLTVGVGAHGQDCRSFPWEALWALSEVWE